MRRGLPAPFSADTRHISPNASPMLDLLTTVDGLGACGHSNKPSDFIVALNAPQYDGGDYCGMTITMTYGGKSTQAVIMDRCAGCPYGALDLSQGLFSFFASTDLGTISGEWVFGSSEEPKTTSTTPKSTSTPQPSPTTTKQPATSTTPPITSSTTTTSKPSSTTNSVPSSSPSTTTTTTTTSSSSVSTTSPTPADDAGALSQMALALVQLCTFVEEIIAE
ncbi:RlpA-like double-psi beta-barrel-protein domain-containing protein-containing protein [Lactarius hengduanensis]|nr:RlpA-like double-psi beta-barrel-protein domain-containing protein-containing protein [Lactarius hengduanensis]